MPDFAHSENIDGIRAIIEYDTVETFMNPRTECDNLGTMICFHRNYNLGDEEKSKSYSGPVDLIATLSGSDFHEKYKNEEEALNAAKPEILWLPLYLFDHGDITMATKPFTCPWDSGQVGIIYLTMQEVMNEYGEVTDDTKDKARNVLEAEVKTYDYYLRNEVYRVSFYVDEGDEFDYEDIEPIDSYGGHLGPLDEFITHVKEEARGYATKP